MYWSQICAFLHLYHTYLEWQENTLPFMQEEIKNTSIKSISLIRRSDQSEGHMDHPVIPLPPHASNSPRPVNKHRILNVVTSLVVEGDRSTGVWHGDCRPLLNFHSRPLRIYRYRLSWIQNYRSSGSREHCPSKKSWEHRFSQKNREYRPSKKNWEHRPSKKNWEHRPS